MTMTIQDIDSFSILASALNVSPGHLSRILNKKKPYTTFKISKKNGGFREIHSPNKELLYLQKRLLVILDNSFKQHNRAFGFAKGKSIINNAKLHLQKKYVLNIDINNFFPSISFARTRNMFIKYFKLKTNISTILAKICCHPDGFLPQGAPTSPIISNILCKSLDKEFVELCRTSRGLTYSRYADDITLSSNYRMSKDIVSLNHDRPHIGKLVKDIIEKNGFEINYDKVRIQNNNQRQMVTGIKVNEKLNVNREYIRTVRAILFSLENSKDLNISIKKFEDSRFSKKIKGLDGVLFFLRGRINFIGNVRGKNDAIYHSFVKRFNCLLVKYNLTNIAFIEQIPNKNVFIIPNQKVPFFDSVKNKPDSIDYGQGTAFYLKNYGLVTNYHVLEFLIEYVNEEILPKKKLTDITFISEDYPDNERSAELIGYSVKHDLALLKINSTGLDIPEGFEKNTDLTKNQNSVLLGFPEYEKGHTIKKVNGQILRSPFIYSESERFEVSQQIFGGNSGGPILNKKGQVLGVAVRGTGSHSNLAIPIKKIEDLKWLKK